MSSSRPASVAPSVSVIIPAFGIANYLGSCIESALAQSHPPSELIVVNDGSPDTELMRAVVSRFGDHVQYIERPNGGVSAARNTGIAAAHGEFVGFLDGDDIWHPQFLQLQMEQFARDPKLSLAYTDARLFGDSPEAGSTFMELEPSTGTVTLESLLAGRCCIPTSAVVARRQSVIDAGLFDEGLRHCEDFDLWFRMAHLGMRMSYQCVPLVYRRIRQGALTSDDIQLNRVAIAVLERFERLHELTPEEHASWLDYVSVLRHHADLGEAKLRIAKGEIDEANRLLSRLEPKRTNWKGRTARFGMRIVPFAVIVAYRGLQRYRQRLHKRYMQSAGQAWQHGPERRSMDSLAPQLNKSVPPSRAPREDLSVRGA